MGYLVWFCKLGVDMAVGVWEKDTYRLTRKGNLMEDTLITMDGEYAFASDPTEKVHILHVNAPGEYSVVIMRQNGYVTKTAANGKREGYHDIIPLQRRPREFWVNVYPTGSSSFLYHKASDAGYMIRDDGETILVREVLD